MGHGNIFIFFFRIKIFLSILVSRISESQLSSLVFLLALMNHGDFVSFFLICFFFSCFILFYFLLFFTIFLIGSDGPPYSCVCRGMLNKYFLII